MSAPILKHPVTNPFGLTDVAFWASPTFADIDGVSNLEAFMGESYGNTLFYRNTGNLAFDVASAQGYLI